MKVCIARNAEARTNADIARVADALNGKADAICLLTRNRNKIKGTRIKKIGYYINDTKILNYEINIKSELGKGLSNIFQLFFFQTVLFWWLLKNRDKYDFIHAFDLDVGLPVFLLSKLIKRKYVYHILDFYSDSRSALPVFLRSTIRKIEYIVINNAEATIICTEDRINQIRGSNPKKLVVIHNTPSISVEIKKLLEEKSVTKEDEESIVFTYVGALSNTRFIEEAIEVIKEYPKITLNLAGMGKLTDHVKAMSSKYKNINYYGVISYIDAIKLYLKTDFMFAIYNPDIPNHKYSAPNKVYEAMLLGKPIIVAKGTGIDRIVVDNNMGLVINYSKEDFEDVIRSIIEKRIDGRELGENASSAYNKYSWEEMKNRLIKVYCYEA